MVSKRKHVVVVEGDGFFIVKVAGKYMLVSTLRNMLLDLRDCEEWQVALPSELPEQSKEEIVKVLDFLTEKGYPLGLEVEMWAAKEEE